MVVSSSTKNNTSVQVFGSSKALPEGSKIDVNWRFRAKLANKNIPFLKALNSPLFYIDAFPHVWTYNWLKHKKIRLSVRNCKLNLEYFIISFDLKAWMA